MIIYWLLFAFFAVGAAITPPALAQAYPNGPVRLVQAREIPLRPAFIIGALATVCMIGLRYKVGADWFNYIGIFQQTQRYQLPTLLQIGDPGFQFLDWVAYSIGADVWLVNLVAGAVFGWGLYRLCATQPSPWLGFAVAVPYMVVVVAMGYTRQSMALGVLMAGLARQVRGASVFNFAIYVAVAALFHRTAVVLFPVVAIASKGNKALNLLVAIFASILLYDYFLGDSMDMFVHNYISVEYNSQGAAIRVTMNMVAAGLLWMFKGKLGFEPHEYRIWRNFSLASLLFLILLFVLPSSTAVDRMSLYLMPLQVAVLTRVALMGHSRLPGTTAVLLYSFLVEFVWLNFAQHADYWVPYQLYPL